VRKLSDLGERRAIQRIARVLTKGKNTSGIGDDCATINLGTDYLLVTTDMMSQRTHIPLQMTPFQMGWFLVAINLSDIAAKGGTPLGVVCSFGLPKQTSEVFLTELAKGADACAVAFDTTIIGGDTKEAGEITLCGTAVGLVKKEEFMSRTGARPGDVVAVTGTLGKAAVGYYALTQHHHSKKLTQAFLEPIPRLKEGRLLARLKCVSSAMDISDGLSASLYQLQDLNTVGFEINQSLLPLAPELYDLLKGGSGMSPAAVGLHFGGEYELLVTIPADAFEAAQKTLKRQNSTLTAIGTVTKKKDVVLDEGKHKTILENKGYEHFKKHTFS
jgi:thiamine-monophosphate kinase